jgi:enoyl-CoA hydratase/carnithine racemase
MRPMTASSTLIGLLFRAQSRRAARPGQTLDPARAATHDFGGKRPETALDTDMADSFASLPASLRAERKGAIAILRLARPEKRNALDDETVLGIEAFFSRLPDGIKAAVIHGEGEHFCAGLDLSELSERDTAEGMFHSRMWHRAFQHIEFGKVPVVAVLHGAVVGGGLELAAAAHVRVAERSAYYGLPEGSRGIYVGGGGSVRLPKLIGTSRVMDMMLTGRTYGAEEGLGIGLSQYLVDNGAGLAKGIELAERIATNALLTNFAITHVLPRIAESDPASGYLAEALMAAIAQGSDEAKARLKDFLEKRGAKVTHG